MSVVEEVIAQLDAEWNVVVTSKPLFLSGHKNNKWEGTNWIFVYNTRSNYKDATLDGLNRDRQEIVTISINSLDTKSKRDDMLSEVTRILNGTFLTGYHYNRILNQRHVDRSESWRTLITVELLLFLETK